MTLARERRVSVQSEVKLGDREIKESASEVELLEFNEGAETSIS